ncbi:unnamed protein product [Bathycoccus prasinos]
MSTLCLDRKLHSFFDLGLKKGLNKTGFILVRPKFLESFWKAVPTITYDTSSSAEACRVCSGS